jgi:glycosyltransferase involved in cell wall biosynthesis
VRLEYLTTALQVGGAEKVVFDLATGMAARGHEVSVTSLMAPTAYVGELELAGIEVRSLGIDRARKDLRQVASALYNYRRAVGARRPDIVHAHMVHANLFGRAAAAFQSSWRLICTIHNTYEGGRLRDLAYRLTNWASDLDTTISEAATRRFVSDHVLPPRTLTVYNGVDVPASVPPPRTDSLRFRWLAVGRLEPQKDYASLLAAITQVPDATLSIAGDGTLRASLEQRAHELGITDRVTFLGTRTDMREQYAAHDGYVLSSAWEGFGLALAEAMASGMPVVATRSGGPSEIIGEGGACGLLVPVGDASALAAAMNAVARLPQEARTEMGRQGCDRIGRLFSRETMLDRWATIYAEVAGRR